MRTLPATVSTAIGQTVTTPVYLVQLGFTVTVYAATWGENISWNGKTWAASGISIGALSRDSARVKFPNGESDPWLALILNEGARGRTISIYEHHTDAASSPQTGAVLVFSGIMDRATIGDSIDVNVIEASRAKTFPPTPIDQPTFTHLLKAGDRIIWGSDTIVVT